MSSETRLDADGGHGRDDAAATTSNGMTAAEAVDRLYAAAKGRPPGYRPQHARGKVFRGTFTPSGDLIGLTRAQHLTAEPSDVLVRFSNGSPDPKTPDTEPGIRGIAVRFGAVGGPAHDLVASNLRAFASRKPEGFVELAELLAKIDPAASRLRRLATGPVTAARFLRFLVAHRESGAAMRAFGKLRPPASFATTGFDGIHAFWLVNADGERTAFRFRLEPEDGEAALQKDGARPEAPQFLLSELEERIARQPVRFALVFQLAGPADPTNDPTKRWPEDRREVVAGRLQVTGVAPDGDTHEREVFDPTRVPDGVELSDDPVLEFRGHVYRLSAERRRAGR